MQHQDKESCKKGQRKKQVYVTGRKIEDISEKIYNSVINSSEEIVFVYQVGTNNIIDD